MFPTEWQGMRVQRLAPLTTRLSDRPIPSPWHLPIDSSGSDFRRRESELSSLGSPIWYMEINLENVDELPDDTSVACVVSFGLVRLPASGGTFNLDEQRAILADTGTVSGQRALPGLIPESIAYSSTGQILSELTFPQSVESNIEGEDESLSDTPLNPSESVFNAVTVHPFGMHDTMGIGVELASEHPRVFFVCNGAMVSMMSLGESGEELASVWPAIGCTGQWLQISTNFGERPFQWNGINSSGERLTIANAVDVPTTKRISDEEVQSQAKSSLMLWLNEQTARSEEESNTRLSAEGVDLPHPSVSPVLNPNDTMALSSQRLYPLSLAQGIDEVNEAWATSPTNNSSLQELAQAEEFELAVALSASTSDVILDDNDSLIRQTIAETDKANSISSVLQDLSFQLGSGPLKGIAPANDDPSYIQIVGGDSDDDDEDEDEEEEDGDLDWHLTPNSQKRGLKGSSRPTAVEELIRQEKVAGNRRKVRAETTDTEVMEELIADGREVERRLKRSVESLLTMTDTAPSVTSTVDEAFSALRMLQDSIDNALNCVSPPHSSRPSPSEPVSPKTASSPLGGGFSVVAAAAAAMGLGVSPSPASSLAPKEEVKAGKGRARTVSKGGPSHKEKLKSIVDRVRTGPTLDVRISAVRELTLFASNPNDCVEAVDCDGLKAVVRLFESKFANESSDLEIATALAISRLVRGVLDATSLLAVAFPVLSALKLVLLRFAATSSVPPAPPLPLSVVPSPRMPRGRTYSSEGFQMGSNNNGGGGDSEDISWESPNSARVIVAKALAHFASLLQQEWASSQSSNQPSSQASDQAGNQPILSAENTSTVKVEVPELKEHVQNTAPPSSSSLASSSVAPQSLQFHNKFRFYENYAVGVVDREHILSGIITLCVMVAPQHPKGHVVMPEPLENDVAVTLNGNSDDDDDDDDSDDNGIKFSDLCEKNQDEKAIRFTAFAMCTIIAFAGSAPLLSHPEAIPVLVGWLRSSNRQVVGFAVGAVAGLCCEDASQKDVYSSGYLDARLVNEGVVSALIHLIHVDRNEVSILKRHGHFGSTINGVKWPEVTTQAVGALRELCRHPPNQEEVLRSVSRDGKTSGLGALVALLTAACVGIPHDRIVADVTRTLLSLSELSETPDRGATNSRGPLRFYSRTTDDIASILEQMVAHGCLPALAKLATLLPGANAMKRRNLAESVIGGTLQSSSSRSISSNGGDEASTTSENEMHLENNPSILALRLLVRIAKVRHLRSCFFEHPGSDALEAFLEIASLASLRKVVQPGTISPNSGSSLSSSNSAISPTNIGGGTGSNNNSQVLGSSTDSGLSRLWQELAQLAAYGLHVISAGADESQLKLMFDSRGVETLLQLCRVAERELSTSLLYPCVATLSKLSAFLLPSDESIHLLAPESLPRSHDPKERGRLKVLFKLLRILKMRRPSAMSPNEPSNGNNSTDSESNRGGGSRGGDSSGGPAEISVYIKTQLAAVRGLTKLSQHPGCRSLIVDHGLEEIVALAVGAHEAAPPLLEGTKLVRSDSGCQPLSDPLFNVEDELRLEAENVVIALGFVQGYKDIELCFNDATLLAVWFHHRRSLQHQAVARWDAACGLSRLWSDSSLNAVRNHLSNLDEPIAGALAERDTARDRTHVHTWQSPTPEYDHSSRHSPHQNHLGHHGEPIVAQSRFLNGRIASNPLLASSLEAEASREQFNARKMSSFGDVPMTVLEHPPMQRAEIGSPLLSSSKKEEAGDTGAHPLPLSSPSSPWPEQPSRENSETETLSDNVASASAVTRASTSPSPGSSSENIAPPIARARTASGNSHISPTSSNTSTLSAGGGAVPKSSLVPTSPLPTTSGLSSNSYSTPPASASSRNSSPFQFSPFGVDWKSGFNKLFFGCAPGHNNDAVAQTTFPSNNFSSLKPLIFASSSETAATTRESLEAADVKREEEWIRRHSFRMLESSQTLNSESNGGGGVGPEWLASVAGYPGSSIANVVSEGLAAAAGETMHVTAQSASIPGRAPGKAEWFEQGRDFFSTFWPAPLQQSLFICPTRAEPWTVALPRVASSAGLTMPRRTYWSFNREARVLKRLLTTAMSADEDSSQGKLIPSISWALCFEDSTYHGDFTPTLHDALHRHPSVNSLSFRGGARGGTSAHDSNTTCLAYLIQDLPQSVRHVTFDDVLSRDAIQLLGVVLQARRRTPVEASNMGFASPNPMGYLHLSGLAIRNHAHLRLEDLASLLKVLEMGDGSSRQHHQGSFDSGSGNSIDTQLHDHVEEVTEDDFQLALSAIPSKLSRDQCETILSQNFPSQPLDIASFEAFQDENGSITKEMFLAGNRFYFKTWQAAQHDRMQQAALMKAAKALRPKEPIMPLPAVSLDPSVGLLWLDLSGNRLGDTGTAAVVAACIGCGNLRGLDLSNNGSLGNADKLSEALVNPRNGLLRLAPRLEALLLHNNALYNKGVLKVFAFLASKPKHESGVEYDSRVQSADSDPEPGRNSLSPPNHHHKGVSEPSRHSKLAVAPGLLWPRKSFEENEVSDSLGCQNNCHLAELGLDHNNLYHSGVSGAELLRYLCDLLAHNCCLRVLCLAHNRLGNEGGKLVMNGLLLNSSLAHTQNPGALHVLRLDGNGVDADRLGLIEDMLRKNRQAFARKLDPASPNIKTTKTTRFSLNSIQMNYEPMHQRNSGGDDYTGASGNGGGGGGGGGSVDRCSKSKSLEHSDVSKMIHGQQHLPIALQKATSFHPESQQQYNETDQRRRAKSDPPAPVAEAIPYYTEVIDALDEEESPPRPQATVVEGYAPSSSLSSASSTRSNSHHKFSSASLNSSHHPPKTSKLHLNHCDEESGFAVLFSAPLAWRDGQGTLTPIPMLDHQAERDMLTRTFNEARRKIKLDFAFATTERLRSMVTLGCHALHFSGHGHPRCLTFEDGAGGLQAVDHERLKSLCAAGGDSGNALRFVFVSACHSHLSGQAFADAGVAHVVCVKKEAEILDSAALSFTRAFYLALAVGRTVADSFTIGREAVAASPHVDAQRGKSESGKFLLLPAATGPDDRRHHVPIFGEGAEYRRQNLMGTQSRANRLGPIDSALCPMPPEDFIGREADMWRMINLLTARRLVTVKGATGCGKSSTVAAVCQYLAAREFFVHGILFVRVRNRNTTLSKLLVRIEAAIREQHAAAQAADVKARVCDDHSDLSQSTLPPLPIQSTEDEFDTESRRLWVLQALKGRSSLLVIDQADYLSQPHTQLRSSYGGAVETELDEGVNGDSGKLDENDDLEDGGGSMDDLENEDLRTFLDELFDAARSIKILLASAMDRPLLDHGAGRGVVEAIVGLGGLNLRDSVRLFCRLSPKLRTAKEREQCLRFLVPPEVPSNPPRNNMRTVRLLEALGNGMPGRIVHVALAETSLDLLMGIAKNISLSERQNERVSPLTVNTSVVPSTSQSQPLPLGGGGSGGSLDPLTQVPSLPAPLSLSSTPPPTASHEVMAISPQDSLDLSRREHEGAPLTRQNTVDLEDVPH